MLWIVLAIIFAGWLIAVAIEQSNSKNAQIAQEQFINSEGYQKVTLVTNKWQDMIVSIENLRIETLENEINILKSTHFPARRKAIEIAKLYAKKAKEEELLRDKQEKLQERMGVTPDYSRGEDYDENGIKKIFRGYNADLRKELGAKRDNLSEKYQVGYYDLEVQKYFPPNGPIPTNAWTKRL